MCKYYGYCRVSTETQAEKGYGLDVQRNSINKYAREHGFEIDRFFVDAGISGTNESRPGLDELLTECLREGDTIIVHTTSRLWRSIFAQATIMKAVINAKAYIKSIDEPSFDIYKFLTDPDNFMINGMMGMLDTWERMTIARKLARGRTAKANKGDKPAGVTPYGYRYTSDKKHVEQVQEEADIVRFMFSEAQKGTNSSQIAKQLNAKGIKTVRAKKWAASNVQAILRNRFYTGVLQHQGKEIPGKHEPIISKVQFGKVQAQLDKRKRTGKAKEAEG